MLNQDIPEEFYKVVEKVAFQLGMKWTRLDWEDIRQEIWVYFMERRQQLKEVVYSTDWERRVRRIGNQVATGLSTSDEAYSGFYRYDVTIVRDLLRQGILEDSSVGTLSEYFDFRNAWDKLESLNSDYAQAIYGRYVEGVAGESNQKQWKLNHLSLAKLAELMNQERFRSMVVSEDSTVQWLPADEVGFVEYYDNQEVWSLVD